MGKRRERWATIAVAIKYLGKSNLREKGFTWLTVSDYKTIIIEESRKQELEAASPTPPTGKSREQSARIRGNVQVIF